MNSSLVNRTECGAEPTVICTTRNPPPNPLTPPPPKKKTTKKNKNKKKNIEVDLIFHVSRLPDVIAI